MFFIIIFFQKLCKLTLSKTFSSSSFQSSKKLQIMESQNLEEWKLIINAPYWDIALQENLFPQKCQEMGEAFFSLNPDWKTWEETQKHEEIELFFSRLYDTTVKHENIFAAKDILKYPIVHQEFWTKVGDPKSTKNTQILWDLIQKKLEQHTNVFQPLIARERDQKKLLQKWFLFIHAKEWTPEMEHLSVYEFYDMIKIFLEHYPSWSTWEEGKDMEDFPLLSEMLLKWESLIFKYFKNIDLAKLSMKTLIENPWWCEKTMKRFWDVLLCKLKDLNCYPPNEEKRVLR